jgi:hypothetical protein
MWLILYDHDGIAAEVLYRALPSLTDVAWSLVIGEFEVIRECERARTMVVL